MAKLVLIRHAEVAVDPSKPSDEWRLTTEGELAAARLRTNPTIGEANRFFSSPEPKAIATAAAIAPGRAVDTVPDLRELDRRAAGWLQNADDYASLVAEILRHPDLSIRGCEPAVRAQERIALAITGLLRGDPDQPLAIVSHGIVLMLYLAWLRGLPRPDLDSWRRLRFPDLAVVDPERRLVLRDFGEWEPS